MIIKQLTVGAFSSNNYLVICEDTKEAVLIDASGDYKSINQELKDLGANLKYIFYTHAHLDHISGDYELKKSLKAKAVIRYLL